MPGIEYRDAASKVNIAFAFDIPDFGVFSAGDENFVALANATGNGGLSAGHQGGIC